MIRKLRRIVAGNQSPGNGPEAVRGRLKLRPSMMELERRALLSTLTVSNTNDSGAGSLRAAMAQADADGGGDTIVFSSLFNSPQTITLTGGQLELTGTATTTISGPGANLLTVSGNNASGVFYLTSGSAATLSGLTITGGHASDGGGVFNDGGTLTLNNVTVSGNSAGVGGGVDNSVVGTLSLTDCTINGNSAGLAGGLGNYGTATLTNCTVTGNSAGSGDSGGLGNLGTATATLTDCTVSGNTAGDGGGLGNLGAATLTLAGCTVSGNTAGAGGGGGLQNDGNTPTLTLINCTVTSNTAGDGGGIADGGFAPTLTLTNCTVSGNTAPTGLDGGLAIPSDGTTTLTNTIVAGNVGGDVSAPYRGSNNLIGGNPLLAALADYGGPTFTMPPLPGSPAIGGGTTTGAPATDQRGQPRTGRIDIGAFQTQPGIIVNTTADGVGSSAGELSLRQALNLANALATADTITFSSLFNSPQTITLTGGQLKLTGTAMTTISGPGANLLSINGNHASRIFYLTSGSAATLSGLTITGGHASDGGGLFNSGGTLTLNNVTLSGNTATFGGGGLFNYFKNGGALSMTNVTLSGNSASTAGGLYNIAPATLTNCTLSGNSAAYGAGALFNRAPATLTNCTVSGNTATNDGGGGLDNSGSVYLTNCTLSGNSATNGDGGGLYSNDDTATLTNCTVTGNTATNGGGLFVTGAYGGTLSLLNVTVTANSAPTGGGVSSSGPETTLTLTNTIVAGQTSGGDISGSYTGSFNLIGVDPELAPLGNYGGPTQTMPLLSGSPALGAGTSSGAPATDERGISRGSSIDLGAFQTQGQHTIIVTSSADGLVTPSGQLSLRQAVNLASTLATAETISFDAGIFATPQTIDLTAGTLSLPNAATTITGPGANLLTLRGNGASRVIDVTGSAAISGLTITGGSDVHGGGLVNFGGTLSLSGVTITGNSAGLTGGGLYNQAGTVRLTSCTVSGNSTNLGGGLYNRATAILINCTVSGNDATSGGGLYTGTISSLTGGTTTLINCTISGNHATGGGGLGSAPSYFNPNTGNYYPGGKVILTNTILAGNSATAYSDVEGRITAGPNNLVGGVPLLAPLGYYGGPTQTMPLLPGSPAIGAGTSSGAPATDQRGFSRGNSVDLGAFQSQGFTLTPLAGTPQSAVVGTGFANALAVTVAANNVGQFVNPVDGGVIGFTAPATNASASLPAAAAIVNGQASVTATAGTTAGSYTVKAAAPGVATPVSFALSNTPGAAAAVAVASGSGQAATVATGFASPLVAVVKDAYGNPVPGVSVTFAAPASGASATLTGSTAQTGANGQASVVATAATISGSFTVTAAVAGVTTPASFALSNTPGAAAAVTVVSGSGQTATVTTGFASPLVAVVKDAYGNLVPGVNIALAAPASGAFATLTGSPARTGANGQAGITATAGTIAGSYTVTAAVAGVTTPASFALSNTPGAPAAVAVVSGTGQAATVATGFASPLVAVVKDAYGNPVPGVSVSFAAPTSGASATLTGSSAQTGANGRASVNATAGTIVGSYIVTAAVLNVTTAASFTLTNTGAFRLGQPPSDDGAQEFDDLTSLRAAIAYADSHPGPDTITFDPAPSGKKRRTIKVIGGPLVLTNPATTTIIGPGASRLLIQGDGKGPVFDIEGGSLALEGLTISGGRAGRGGGIRNKDGRLLLNDVVIRGNRARVGGGLYNDGTAVLSDVVIRGNLARIGSGLFSTRTATLTWSRSPAGRRG
jgi:fibronectin-binding autotransporter adhesin